MRSLLQEVGVSYGVTKMVTSVITMLATRRYLNIRSSLKTIYSRTIKLSIERSYLSNGFLKQSLKKEHMHIKTLAKAVGRFRGSLRLYVAPCNLVI